MYLQGLPDKINQELIAISKDIQHPFNWRISEDKILDELDEMDFSMSDERKCTQAFLGYPIAFYGFKFKPISLIMWHVLWSISSPVLGSNINDIKVKDLDVFFYLLENKFDGDFENLEKNSDLFCMKHYSKIFMHLPEIMLQLIKISFSPLQVFPAKVVNEKHKMLADVDWLAGHLSCVHEMTGLSPDEILHKSLTYCCSFFVQKARKNGVKNLERQPREEVLKMKDERYVELLCDWLIEKGLIEATEKAKYFKMMTTPPEERENG